MAGFVSGAGYFPQGGIRRVDALSRGSRGCYSGCRTSVRMVATDPAKKTTGSSSSMWEHQYITEVPDSLVTGPGDKGPDSMRAKFERMVRKAQNDLCTAIEELDGQGKFHEDAWVRETGGGGISRVLQDGKVRRKKRWERQAFLPLFVCACMILLVLPSEQTEL